MRIGIIHPYQHCKGGGERICCYLANHLIKKGFDVSVFSEQEQLAYPEIFEDKSPRVVLPKIKIRSFDTAGFELYKHWLYPFLFDYKGIDILIDTMGASIFHAKINKKVKIFYFHFPPTKKFLNPYVNFPNSLYYDFKDALEKISLKIKKDVEFACNSNYIKNLLKKYYDIDAEIIRPPVDTNFFKPAKKPKEDFVLLTGRIRRFKKFELALKYLKNENVILAGQINELDYFNELKRKYPFVKFITNIDDEKLKYLYQNCKFYVFTNWEEHFGIVPFEAMSCEKKVIVPEFCGASELVEDGVNGFIVKKDFSNFREKMKELLNSDEKIAKNARKTVVENLSLDVFGKGFENLLRDYL